MLVHRRLRSLLVVALLAPPACAHRAEPATAAHPEQAEFWARLQRLCGQAFDGRVVEAPATDTAFAGRDLVMHVRECRDDEVRIPLHVGEDRSRTWVVTRTAAGLRLKHDHRHPDGTADSNTEYGGDTASPGTAERQTFPADAFSVERVPARASQDWFLEIRPGTQFVYGLHRRATDMRYRMEFDLARTVPPPPAPWGSDEGGSR